MRKTIKSVVTFISLVSLLINPVLLAERNPPPGRWEKVSQTKIGERINIRMKSGVTHKYKYWSIDDKTLICKGRDQETLELDIAAIDKIVIPKAGKYAGYGALIGAAGGLGASALLITGMDASTSTGGFISFMAICSGLGAAMGAGLGGSGEIIYISKEAASGGVK